MTLLNHADHLTTACQCLDALASKRYFVVVEELPLLKAHEYLAVNALKVLVVRGMFEAQFFGLVKDVLKQEVPLYLSGSTFVSPAPCPVLCLVDISIISTVAAVFVFFLIDLLVNSQYDAIVSSCCTS